MGAGYELINLYKKEVISFARVCTGTKKRELAGTVIAGSIVTYYMLSNIGDRITFLDDHSDNFEVFGITITWEDIRNYNDVTEEVIRALIKEDIYVSEGKIWIDKEENLFFHDLVNVWDPKVNKKDI